MSIKERKLRKVGNSVVLTISKEFLKENGLNLGDTVFSMKKSFNQRLQKRKLCLMKLA